MITDQIAKHGPNEVNLVVAASVNKCLDSLGIEMQNDRIQLLVEDIVDKYQFDSIEDIQICLKNGRQGNYGTNFGKLNMIVISEWMSSHLERKASARELSNDKAKHDFKNREEYENAVNVGSKINDQEKKDKASKKHDDIEYEEFRAKYLENQNKLS